MAGFGFPGFVTSAPDYDYDYDYEYQSVVLSSAQRTVRYYAI